MRFYELFIALRYMTANIKQSLIIAGAVGIGVSIIIFVPSINLSFFNDLIEKTVSSAPHIEVTKELDTFQRDMRIMSRQFDKKILLVNQTLTRRRNIISYKSVIKQISPLNEVVTASPYANGQGVVIRGAEERGATIKGVIPENEVRITNIKNYIIQGRITSLGIDDIVLGTRLADKLKAKMEDRVSVTGPRGTAKSFKIVGIFSTGLRGLDEGQIYVNLKAGQLLNDLGTNVNAIGVKVKDIYQADNVATRIRQITGLDAKSWMEDNKQILEQITRFRIIIAFINFLIVFAAASSITSVFILLIASKSREIGILKSMGAKNISVMFVFLSQAMILSIMGYLAGLIGAKLLIAWYSHILSSATETFLTTTIPVLKINWQYAMLALLYSMLTSFLASILPAYQAARLNPVEAINA